MTRDPSQQFLFLYTDIGRGHPNYLDSVLRVLEEKLCSTPDKLSKTSVQTESRGLSRFAWKMVEKIYRSGGRGGQISKIYNKIRNSRKNTDNNSLIMKYLGRDLRKKLADYGGTVVVAHPLLVQLLADVCRVWYLHGEIAWPVEFDLMRAEKIFVPLEITQDRMMTADLMRAQFGTTGLVIEPELISCIDECHLARKRRIDNGVQPTFAFFTSGAYPRPHIDQIMKAISHILSGKLGRVILSAGTDRSKINHFRHKLSKFRPTSDIEAFYNQESSFLEIGLPDRENLTLLDCELLPSADILIMAAHERINWSVGLGLPTIFLTPHFGSFAPLNYQFARENALIYGDEDEDIRLSLDRFVQDFRSRNQRLIFETKKFGLEGAPRIADIIMKELN